MNVICFVYSDYAGDGIDQESMSGCNVKLENAVCSCGSKMQPPVALSICEAGYYAMTQAAKGVTWISRIRDDSGSKLHYPVEMSSDNQSAPLGSPRKTPPLVELNILM